MIVTVKKDLFRLSTANRINNSAEECRDDNRDESIPKYTRSSSNTTQIGNNVHLQYTQRRKLSPAYYSPSKKRISNDFSQCTIINTSHMIQGGGRFTKNTDSIFDETMKYISRFSRVSPPRICSRDCKINTTKSACWHLLSRKSYSSSDDEEYSSSDEHTDHIDLTSNILNDCKFSPRNSQVSEKKQKNGRKISDQDRISIQKQKDELIALKYLLPSNFRYQSKVDIMKAACDFIINMTTEIENLEKKFQTEAVRQRRLKARLRRQDSLRDLSISDYVALNCGHINGFNEFFSNSFSI
ncbi:hypothetical protein GJ496_009391 [Pomphorhynchus laevis]|nr:hypothetical protein GJ496_009391 [Pomphorhynchus laevis]